MRIHRSLRLCGSVAYSYWKVLCTTVELSRDMGDMFLIDIFEEWLKLTKRTSYSESTTRSGECYALFVRLRVWQENRIRLKIKYQD